jgi:hypothetical protein
MQKIIHLEPNFATGEPTVQPVMLWANGRACYESITKHASVGEDYFKTITPVPGHSIVYVLALGAWERYGENRNGDAFPEFPYMETANPPGIEEKDTLINNYKTFEQFGYNYRHHKNRDPNQAVGKVLKAFWNPMMHRVELLIDLEDSKAPDLAERIANNEFPPVSMGTRVPYDVCSVCNNRAPTRKEYCDHLRLRMRDVINGKKVCALNPSPKFFDISWVYRPADRTAFMLKKVAEDIPYNVIGGLAAGEYMEGIERDKQAAHKVAVIDKIVQGIPVQAKDSSPLSDQEIGHLQSLRPSFLDAAQRTPELPDSLLRNIAEHSIPTILSSAISTGMIQISTPELTKIIMFKTMPNTPVSSGILNRSVALQSGILGLLADHPEVLHAIQATGALDLSNANVNPEVAQKLGAYREKRAGIGQYLKRNLIPERYRDPSDNTTNLTMTDPASGAQYSTSTGAAIRAHDEIAKRNLYKVIGGGALLGGAYKLITTGLAGKVPYIRPLTAGILGTVGASQFPSMGKHYMTDQGVPIPTLTELTKTSASEAAAVPLLGTLGIMAALSNDYQSRLNSGVPIGTPGLPLSRRILDQTEDFAHHHPVISAGIGTVGGALLGGTREGKFIKNKASTLVSNIKNKYMPRAKELVTQFNAGTKLASYVQHCFIESNDTVTLPSVDLDKLAEWIGYVIVDG